MIFVNFKTFKEGTGVNAVSLAKLLYLVASQTQHKVIPVVQASDIKEVVETCGLEVWVQKIDPVEFGASTGSILAEAVFEDGAVGTFLNHSEAKFRDFSMLEKAHARALGVGLKTLVFAQDLSELKEIVNLKPTFVAYEPSELIGSKTISVSQAHPEIIEKAASIARDARIPLVVGAGVHSNNDVRISLKLGAIGVAVATDIVKAENPEKELLDLIEGFE
ncbi:MAG TPA: triose-phosphate isomerase [Patescibacteria group bacterium]|nr:triose-phosphate isomerase [Patescibacteria group bacterium]